MIDIKIEAPHGYLLDDKDRVVLRFANWQIGYHKVPDVVDNIDYVDGPADHERAVHEDYKKSEK